MVEVPVVWEVPPRRGLVAVALGAVGFVGFVGLSLVLQDLRDSSAMGFGGDEDLWEDQRACRLSPLLTLVLSDSPDWARVDVVCGGGGDRSELRWWLSTGVGGFGGRGLVRVMGVGTRVWLSSGRGGRGIWFT